MSTVPVPDLRGSFAVTAALLHQGQGIARLGWLVTGLGFAGLIAQIVLIGTRFDAEFTSSAPGVAVCAALVLLGGYGQYLALRVGFDAILFDALATTERSATDAALAKLDAALAALALAPPADASRRIRDRCQGALRLLRQQAAVVVAQLLLGVLGAVWLT